MNEAAGHGHDPAPRSAAGLAPAETLADAAGASVRLAGEVDAATLDALMRADHGDPFAVLGLHAVVQAGGVRTQVVRALIPGAADVRLLDGQGRPLRWLWRQGLSALFTGELSAEAGATGSSEGGYQLDIGWAGPDGRVSHRSTTIDPYALGPQLGEMDLWLLAEGTHQRPYEILGAHPRAVDGVVGTRFAVWAPAARRVSVVGSFNGWDGRRHAMRLRRECGVWEIFLPQVGPGDLYKFEILGADGLVHLKADPFGFRSELRPHTASVVQPLLPVVPVSEARRAANALDAPISVYEVHLGSWRRRHDGGWLSYRELADQLIPYAVDLGFTHLELLPIHEHPFDGSWGYQPVGLYAPTSRFGSPEDLRAFVDAAHAAGLGVICDWVPAHFPTDSHGLARFDGSHLYEHADPREGFHQDWNTLIYNFGRTEVRNVLVGNALYWLERYGMDGLRVDAVASMLYRDYSRDEGQWIPNRHGGRENLEAIDFLRRMNHGVGTQRPGAMTLAEESTAFPQVTQPPSADLQGGGLGFHFKWNMGWMNDTLAYFAREPIHRQHHHDQIRFSLVYAFSENFVLPISHDEVVHGKGSMLGKMPGDDWQKFANLRAFYGYMWGHPGKKLLFMGCEFGQRHEWKADASLDWHLLGMGPHHAGVQRLVRDLNRVYRDFPALHQLDVSPEGFAWISHDDAAHSLLVFARRAADGSQVLVVCNFTPVPRLGWRVGVPLPGRWRSLINTDAMVYGGSGVGPVDATLVSEPQPWQGQAQSLLVDLPPLATLMLVAER